MSRTACLLSTACLLATTLSWSTPVAALRVASPRTTPVDLQLVDRASGAALPRYTHRGTHWVAGAPGRPYAIRLTNTTGARVLVVLSVDGVNAVSGETADVAQTGYVLDAWQSTDIAGWRKSYADIAGFTFTALPDSYAARTGRPDNVGTVGIAVFEERVPPPVRPMPRTDRAAEAASPPMPTSAAPGSDANARGDATQSAVQRLGTGHGPREWAPVSQTSFVRAHRTPIAVVELRYDAPEALAALGIGPQQPPMGSPHVPHAFPPAFVPDPPGHD
ncbi:MULTISPECIES: hypothetical protein [Luteimonas]|uniref:hypothetical protein n=1 Tax=Luteimonas TaxID=83614 RepID=UPI001E5D2A9F|nr:MULTISPECIES: hypothetical protein [Luteimonas]